PSPTPPPWASCPCPARSSTASCSSWSTSSGSGRSSRAGTFPRPRPRRTRRAWAKRSTRWSPSPEGERHEKRVLADDGFARRPHGRAEPGAGAGRGVELMETARVGSDKVEPGDPRYADLVRRGFNKRFAG